MAAREPSAPNLVSSRMNLASKGHLRTALGLLVLLCLGIGCGTPESDPEPDLTTVHGAFLRSEGGVLLVRQVRVTEMGPNNDELLPPEMHLPGAKTWGDARRTSAMDALKGLRRETWDAFVAANAEPADLSKTVRFSGTIHWLSEEDRIRAFPDGGDLDACYDRLFERHPGSDELLGMSVPGMSRDGAQALLYVQRTSGGLDGSGSYYLLVREGDGWKIVAQYRAWIS